MYYITVIVSLAACELVGGGECTGGRCGGGGGRRGGGRGGGGVGGGGLRQVVVVARVQFREARHAALHLAELLIAVAALRVRFTATYT